MHSADSVKKILTAHLDELKRKYPIEQLALFGSITREDFNPGKSDVDIMVEFNGDIGWEFFDLKDELEKLLEHEVDLVSRRAIKPHYWEHIKDDVINV
jgi:predicted nucleotidyltransferase